MPPPPPTVEGAPGNSPSYGKIAMLICDDRSSVTESDGVASEGAILPESTAGKFSGVQLDLASFNSHFWFDR